MNIFKKIFQNKFKYFIQSSEIHFQNVDYYDPKNEFFSYYRIYNKYCYRSSNEIGLIYITLFQDIEKANIYLSKSAFGEYPYAQNNYGLMNQFYNNKIEDAKYLYERSSRHHFAIAEYNLGYIKEKDAKIEDAIEYYIKASEHEDEPLMFQNNLHIDYRLNISKMFIICFTNLKLVDYFLSKSNYEEARKYFIKSFSKFSLNKEPYEFRFKYQPEQKEDCFAYLRSYILGFPLFNLINQPNLSLIYECEIIFNQRKLNSKMAHQIYSEPKKEFYREEFKFNDNICESNIFNVDDMENKINSIKFIENHIYNDQKSINNECLYQNAIDKEIIIFEDFKQFFDFATQNKELIKSFISEIKNIIHIMEKILYTPPYIFLFGRLSTEEKNQNKKEEENDLLMIDINALFYEGFGMNSI